MDQECKKLPLFVIFLLFWGSAYGFKGDLNSPQPSDNTSSPHAVQSFVSEVPVTGILPEEVGSRFFTNRPLKKLNLLQFVKGHVSSRHELTSHAQSAPGSSFQGEAAGLGSFVDVSLQSQGTSSHLLPSVVEVSNQSTNGQSTPSFFVVGSDSSSDPQSTGPVSPLETQGGLSHSILSTQTQGSASTTQGSSEPEWSGSSAQLIPTQVESGGYGGVSKSLSTSSQHSPGYLLYHQFNALPVVVSRQSTNTQSSPSTQSRSGTITSSHFLPVQRGSSYSSSLSLKPQGTLGLYAPASPTKYVGVPMSSHPAIYSQSTSSSGTQFGTSTGFASQGMSSTHSGSVQPQSTTSQFAPGSPSSYPSVSISSPQGSASQSAAVQSSRKQFTSSYGTQSGSFSPLTLQGSTTYRGSLQPQGISSQFAPGSLSSYPSVSLSSPQGTASRSATVQSSRKQFTSTFTGSSGTQEGFSMPLTLQGSTTYRGSLQPQGTPSQFAPGSPSYPSASLSSPQGAASQFAAVQSSRKQFTSSYGTQSGSSLPFTLQGSTTYRGSLQPQGTTSQVAPGSLSSPQGAASQSTTVQSSRKQFMSTLTGSPGTQEGSSTPLILQGSTTYRGSLQPQGTPSQFAPGSPFSPQGAASQSAAVQSSRKQFTSSYGTQSGSFSPLTLQGSTTYRGSLQPQGISSQFAPGSLSSYPSVSLSSQGTASQSATVQSSRKQFTSTFTGSSGTQEGSSTPLILQGSATYRGSLQPQGTTSQFALGSRSSPQGAASQSTTVQSSRKQFTSTFTGSPGTQEGFSMPLTLQGSTTYRGSLQPQGTTSRFALGSLSSPQGAASQSTTVQSSRKQFTSTFTGSPGTQEGFSMPLTLQGSTTYRGSLQPQGTPSQFAPGSPFSPQGAASQSAAVQSSRKQFTSSYGTQSGSFSPLTLQGSATYRGSLQPQGISSQFAPGSLSSYPSVSLSSPQGTASQSATVQSSRKQFTSSYGGFSLHSQSSSSKYTPGSHSYAKLGSSPLAVSTQSTSDQRSNGLYISDSLRSQGLHVVDRPSRLSYQVPSDSPSSNKISKSFVTSQRPAGSNLAPSLGLSAQAPSVMFSILQAAQALRESGSDVQLYNQPFLKPVQRQGLRDSRKFSHNAK